MEKFEQLTEMLCAELDRIQSKGELSSASLNQAHVIASTWKDIETAAAMAKEREGGYSEHYPYYPMMYRGGAYDDGGSYGPGRGRGSNANRDSMGRYSSENRRGSYEGRGSYGGSYDDGESMGAYRNRYTRGRICKRVRLFG